MPRTPAIVVAAILVAASFAAALPAAAGPATAQEEPEEENAVDIRKEINDHFDGRMPYGWWISIPEARNAGFAVTVHIPDWWKGNPTAAVMALCPDRRSRVWKGTPLLALTPFYQKRPWPGFDCRE